MVRRVDGTGDKDHLNQVESKPGKLEKMKDFFRGIFSKISGIFTKQTPVQIPSEVRKLNLNEAIETKIKSSTDHGYLNFLQHKMFSYRGGREIDLQNEQLNLLKNYISDEKKHEKSIENFFKKHIEIHHSEKNEPWVKIAIPHILVKNNGQNLEVKTSNEIQELISDMKNNGFSEEKILFVMQSISNLDINYNNGIVRIEKPCDFKMMNDYSIDIKGESIKVEIKVKDATVGPSVTLTPLDKKYPKVNLDQKKDLTISLEIPKEGNSVKQTISFN